MAFTVATGALPTNKWERVSRGFTLEFSRMVCRHGVALTCAPAVLTLNLRPARQMLEGVATRLQNACPGSLDCRLVAVGPRQVGPLHSLQSREHPNQCVNDDHANVRLLLTPEGYPPSLSSRATGARSVGS